MKKTFLITIIFLAVANMVEAQQERSFEVAIVPTLGFNTSFSTFKKGYKKNYSFISANRSGKDLYYALGLQFRYLEDIQLTIRYGQTDIGAGYTMKPQNYKSGTYQVVTDYTSTFVNVLDATIEKRIAKMSFLNNWSYPCKVDFSGMIGFRYMNIVRQNRTDSLYPLPNFKIPLVNTEGYEKQHRNGGVALNFGLNAQLFVKKHRSLKIGVLYNYLLKPIVEYQYHIETTSYENGSYKTYQDDFALIAGRHQVLFYIEYPIKLFRIKY